MKKLGVLGTLVLLAAASRGADEPKKIPPMPVAVTSNAVAVVRDGLEIYSLMGMGPRKTWDDVTNRIYVLDLAHPKWREGKTVPGAAGRLGASAAGIKGFVILMGGYVLDSQGESIVVPDVNVYEPAAHRWSRAQDIPTPVDSAVVGVAHDRFVYLIGGRSPNGPTNIVQVYDIQKNAWAQATPFPGTPVFGQAGGLDDNDIVVIDGAKAGPAGGPRYLSSDECWLGKIDKKDPYKIEWTRLPAHPGPARFGIAGGSGGRDHRIFFTGGTTTPHDYKGTSYDGQPTEVSEFTFAYETHGRKWETASETNDDPRADSRGIVMTRIGPLVIGGLVKNLAVTQRLTQVERK
jgi:N-acetylneuraminic acid mutarotase